MNKTVFVLILTAVLGLPLRVASQGDENAQPADSPAVNVTEENVPVPVEATPTPEPVYEPPAAGSGAENIPGRPRRRKSSRFNNRLNEQESQVLQQHMENAAQGSASKPAPATTNGKSKNHAKSAATTTPQNGLLNVDYVDEPILDVLRAIATAFKLSVIPDKDLGDVKVTIHLENIPVLEGLDKLCRSHGLELVADGHVYKVRKARENAFSVIEVKGKRMNLDVQNRPVKEFLREFVEKTKINIVPGQDLRGTVTGHLKDVSPIDGFKALMAANSYEVRLKNGVYLVENGDATAGGAPGMNPRRPRSFPGPTGGNADVDVLDGRVTLSLTNASLGDAIREIAEQAGLNFTIIGDVTGNVNAQLKGVSVEEALTSLLQGTRFAFINRDGTLLIGDRNPNTPSGQALSGAELIYLKFIKVENIEKIMPKSIPAENVKVIKEQNAVLISGTGDDITLVKNFLTKVDIPTPQVLMEVVVVEYSRGKESDFGIGGGKTAYQGANVNIDGNMSGVRNTFQQGSFKGVIGILPPKFDLSLRALESKNKAKILAMPKVTTLNGNKAELKVSRTSFYQVSSVTKDGFQNNDFRTIEDGITIELTPWVTKHGEVNVSINPSIKTSTPATGSAPAPVTNRSIATNVRLMDGETIALGGLINSQEDNSREFVPVLGSIPVLGYLFSWRKSRTITTELVIYVTPHILNPDAQGVNLEEEFESLDDRSGFLKNSDFIRPSRNPAAAGSSHAGDKGKNAANPGSVRPAAGKDKPVVAPKPQSVDKPENKIPATPAAPGPPPPAGATVPPLPGTPFVPVDSGRVR